jgi:hypothetical protein
MNGWTTERPTMILRWVDRYVGTTLVSVLQQKWEITRGGTGAVEYTEEWRDVPKKTETAK